MVVRHLYSCEVNKRLRCQSVIGRLGQDPATRKGWVKTQPTNLVVIVSHDLGQLHKMCTRGIWMHEGKVRVDSAITDTITQYLTFTQAIDARNAAAAAGLAAIAQSESR